MRTLFSFAVWIVSLAAWSPASAASPRLLRFDAAVVDLGRVEAHGGAVVAEFRFTNISDRPVTLVEVRAQCGCTIPAFDRKPVAPGGRGVVRVTFDPHTLSGENAKNLTAVADNGSYRKFSTLTVKADVTGQVETDIHGRRISRAGASSEVSHR